MKNSLNITIFGLVRAMELFNRRRYYTTIAHPISAESLVVLFNSKLNHKKLNSLALS